MHHRPTGDTSDVALPLRQEAGVVTIVEAENVTMILDPVGVLLHLLHADMIDHLHPDAAVLLDLVIFRLSHR